MSARRCRHRVWVRVTAGEATVYAVHGARERCRDCGRERVQSLGHPDALHDAEDLAASLETVHSSTPDWRST